MAIGRRYGVRSDWAQLHKAPYLSFVCIFQVKKAAGTPCENQARYARGCEIISLKGKLVFTIMSSNPCCPCSVVRKLPCFLAALTLPTPASALPHFTPSWPCLTRWLFITAQLLWRLVPASPGESRAEERAVNFRPQGPMVLGNSVILCPPQGTLEKARALSPG